MEIFKLYIVFFTISILKGFKNINLIAETIGWRLIEKILFVGKISRNMLQIIHKQWMI